MISQMIEAARARLDRAIREWHPIAVFGLFSGGHDSFCATYARLKERQLRRLQREYGANGRGGKQRRVLYVSGCRSQESERRMGNTTEVEIEPQRIWVAPIHDWSKLDTSNCLEFTYQPRNQVVDLIHKSGECLCGAFAKKGELEELNLWDITRPAYQQIRALEAEIVPEFGRGWGERPQRGGKKQMRLPGMLCWSCDKAGGL
jgi:predicted phosphoadenosine phosphosulfate sulfurtransferase